MEATREVGRNLELRKIVTQCSGVNHQLSGEVASDEDDFPAVSVSFPSRDYGNEEEIHGNDDGYL